MRQFITLRFWMSLLALVGLTAGVWLIVHDSGSTLADLGGPEVVEHRIDQVIHVYAVQASQDYALVDGVVQGELRFLIDSTRTVVLRAGTPGEITCPQLAEIAQCTVAIDLLGDAVVWFSLFNAKRRATIPLPAISELRDDGWVLLANGWEVRHAAVVERDCPTDTSSLSEFIRVFGDESTSTFDMESQQVIKVTCIPPTP